MVIEATQQAMDDTGAKVVLTSIGGQEVASLWVSEDMRFFEFRELVSKHIAQPPSSLKFLSDAGLVEGNADQNLLSLCSAADQHGVVNLSVVTMDLAAFGDHVFLQCANGHALLAGAAESKFEASQGTRLTLVRGIAKKSDRARNRGWHGDKDEHPPVSFRLDDGRYLRHSNAWVRADHDDTSPHFRLDATWRQSPDKFKEGTFAFQSVNYPTHYIGVVNGQPQIVAEKYATGFYLEFA